MNQETNDFLSTNLNEAHETFNSIIAELFNNKKIIYTKYIILCFASIVFVKLYHKIFNPGKFDEFVHYLVGLFLGGTFVGLLNKDLNDNMSDTKEKRDLVNRLKTLKEEYKELHDNAVIIIDIIFSMNDKLWDEIDKSKSLIKK